MKKHTDMQIYERNINSKVCRVEDDVIETEASLLDLSHGIKIVLRIDLQTRIIEKTRVDVARIPFEICDQAMQTLSRIEGEKINRGIKS